MGVDLRRTSRIRALSDNDRNEKTSDDERGASTFRSLTYNLSGRLMVRLLAASGVVVIGESVAMNDKGDMSLAARW